MADEEDPNSRLVEFQGIVSASFMGPLPPPEVLAGYEETLPGAAERILTLAEEQARHRMSLEAYELHAEARRAIWGLMAGFFVAMAFLAGSLVLVLSGYETAGTVLATVDIVGLVVAFVYGARVQNEE